MNMKTIGIVSANYVSGDFGELTNKRTLASIPFGGRYRLIDFALSNMTNSGIKTVGVIAPYNSGSLIDHIGVGKPWSLDRKTGGLFVMPGSIFGVTLTGNRFLMRDIAANKSFLEMDDADYVVVTGSSDVCNIDYTPIIEAHAESGNPITIVTKKVDNAEDYRGFFVTKDGNGKVTEMVTHAERTADYFMDCFVIDRKFMIEFINWFGALDYMDVMDIVSQNLKTISVGSYEFKGYFGKISNLNDYFNVNMQLLDPKVMNEVFGSDRTIWTKVQDEAPAGFKPGSNVRNSLVAAGCEIEGTVENSIIFRSTKVAKGAVVKNSIILQHGDIKKSVKIDKAILDKYVTVNEGVQITGGEAPIVIGKSKSI